MSITSREGCDSEGVKELIKAVITLAKKESKTTTKPIFQIISKL